MGWKIKDSILPRWTERHGERGRDEGGERGGKKKRKEAEGSIGTTEFRRSFENRWRARILKEIPVSSGFREGVFRVNELSNPRGNSSAALTPSPFPSIRRIPNSSLQTCTTVQAFRCNNNTFHRACRSRSKRTNRESFETRSLETTSRSYGPVESD